MIRNLFRRFRERRRQKKKDLFARIRVRLTLTYSGMLILILLLFTLIVSGVLYAVISQEQGRLLEAQVAEQVELYEDVLRQLPEGRGYIPRVEEPTGPGAPRFFTYIVNREGQLLVSNEGIPEVRPMLVQRLNGWVPRNGDKRLTTLPLMRHGKEMRLLMAGQSFYQNGRLVGVLYTGHDVSFYWDVFEWIRHVLFVLIVVFGGIATFVGSRMAARAMVPIRNSYLKQQEFVADASHELRTPLTVLKSSIEVIELEDGEAMSELSRRVMADMKDEVNSMSKLVADLLTLARSDSGAVELYEQRFDLVAVAEQVVRLRGVAAQEKAIDLALEAPTSLMMKGDQERVKQLLAILVDNALNYTPAGGRVTVSVGGEYTGMRTLRAHVLRVTDTGIGIAPEDQERIFERFYRVEAARSRAAGGTGIGLAIAKWIVDAHKGSIAVQSTLGTGSTFTVRLPIRK